ncbi:SMI1/KNR4 family protein [Nonomuraea sp. NPDC049419]|uniref:SMI1/KNR4 family protein n=1 Tax=Nonomuraea sp. NPDC049419 TaxID=3155772 RepID=UPI00344AA311
MTQLAALKRPIVAALSPGLSSEQVESELGCSVPEDVAIWFGWCNGVAYFAGQTQDDANLIPGYAPLSLSEAVVLRESYPDDPVLGPDWIPLLGNASGDFYAALWRGSEQPQVAGVLSGEPTEIEFQNIELMISVFSECYFRGAFGVDERGMLTMDPELYEVVHSEVVGQYM